MGVANKQNIAYITLKIGVVIKLPTLKTGVVLTICILIMGVGALI